MSNTHLTDIRFDQLPIAQPVLDGLARNGISHCTPIQAEALEKLLAGQDVAGQAQTGTGKTLAFLTAVFHRLLTKPADANRKANQPRALIMAPTRELAVQIEKDAKLLAESCGFSIGCVYGGTAYRQQMEMVSEGVDILIGTTGRLIDYLKQRCFDLRAVDALVLDEADRMFDLGFIKDVRFMIRRCPAPEKRLSMLFSATLSYRVNELAYEHMNNPQQVTIESTKKTANRVEECLFHPANSEKIPLLLGLVNQLKPERAMVFVNTKHAADRVCGYLLGNGLKAGLLSGDVPQNKRLRLLSEFQAGELQLLVATDVAARGLHIDGVSHVFNYDLPQDSEDYVHRVGRTARAGASGEAISFACEDYAYYLPDIETFIERSLETRAISDVELPQEIKPAQRIAKKPAHNARNRSGCRPNSAGQRSPRRSPKS